ncbi:MAG: hypothetical protein V3V00_13450 [Saprospiraceae bacterium]
MAEIIKETKQSVVFNFKSWGRTFRVKLNKARHPRAVLFFRHTDTSMQTVPEIMRPLYDSYEKTHEWGENGVQKATDLVRYYGIREL